jgi:hypothetical protein
MNLFTYITGIASLIGLFLQLKDVFPKYKELRKTILFVTTGIFIGTMLGGIRLFQLNLFLPQNVFEFLLLILICGGLLIVFIFVFALISTKNDDKRIVFMIVLMLSGAALVGSSAALFSTVKMPGISNNKELTLGELKLLADTYETNKNYDRCIYFLEIMKSKIEPNDLRLSLINQKLESIKTKQLEKVP